ncbi:MAG: sporulation integral membrane protein YtvI [Acetivibrionales bacterium]|jgi:sporulation integral membrane protein YtvI
MIEQNGLDFKKLIKIIIAALLLAVLLYAVYKLIYYVAPIIIAFAISSVLEPIIKFISKKAKVSRKTAAPITLLLVIIPFGVIFTLIIIRLVSEIKAISKVLPKYFSELYGIINSLIIKSTEIYNWLPRDITDNMGNIISNMSATLIGVLNSTVEAIVNTVISIPQTMIFLIVTILSTYFIASDRERISVFLREQLPESWIRKITSIKDDMFAAFFGYLKAQLIMMSITFVELYVGFMIIGIRYSLLLAFIISIVDALPILGSGTVLIPWGVFELITGNIRMGISLLIIYIIVLIVRQLIEPKILSHQIGIYPLVTLTAMYAGLRLIGVFGLILAPITVLVLKNIIKGIVKNRPIKELLNKKDSSANNK